MRLERDEFVVTYDAMKATPKTLLAAIRRAGYTAQLVGGKGAQPAPAAMPEELPPGFALLDEALAQARREQKPVVLDFTAAWCAPCRQMERTTFVDAQVKALLQLCVLVKIDTDEHAELAQRLGVVGLPDIRFVTTAGKIVRQLRGFQNAEAFADELRRLTQSVER